MRSIVKIFLLCLPVWLLTSCGSSKNLAKENPAANNSASVKATELLTRSEEQATPEYLTAKMKFNYIQGKQDISVGGSLKMKRDDVIQLSLVALGIVEAARIEFTKDEVLIIDRINKRYVRCAYNQLSFLAQAELNFYSLQALFRNELFVPGKTTLKGNESLLKNTRTTSSEAEYTYQNTQLKYTFLVNVADALLKEVKVGAAKGHEDIQFNWQYSDQRLSNGRQYPTRYNVTLSGTKGFEVNITLSNISNDSKWETRTSVKNSYTQMDAKELLQMLAKMNG